MTRYHALGWLLMTLSATLVVVGLWAGMALLFAIAG